MKNLFGGSSSPAAAPTPTPPAPTPALPQAPSTQPTATQTQNDDQRVVAAQGLQSTVLTSPNINTNLDVQKKSLLGG